MLICPSCNYEQEVGKFCGKCGTETVASTASVEQQINKNKEEIPYESASTQTTSQTIGQDEVAIEQSNVNTQQTVEVTKQALGQYWNYFLHILKNPTRAFNIQQNHFIYGLVTIGIYAIAFSLSLYFLAQSYYKKFTTFTGMFGGYSPLPFLKTNMSLILLFIIFLAIAFFSAFIVIKLAKNNLDFKTLIAQFGGLIIPFTALNVIAVLGGVIGSVFITLIPLFLSVLFVFTYIPVMFTYEKVNQVNSQGQKVYLSLLTVILMIVFSLILSDVVIMNMIDSLEELIYYLG